MIDWLYNNTPLLYLTQSLWRDETFSVLVAEYGWLDIVKLTINDFTPPLYYFLLKMWMMFFGRSEIAIRMLSFVFYLGTVVMSYKFAKNVIRIPHRWFPIVTTLLVAVNPMMLYYALEARVYALVVFFVLSSMYFFLRNKKKPYIVFSLLAIYAHPYSLLALAAQLIYVFFYDRTFLREFTKRAFIIGAFYLPWTVAILYQLTRSSDMWYYPVTGELILGILGSMYIGYEGTPGNLWGWVILLSAVIGGITLFGNWNKKVKKEYTLLLLWFLFPVIIVLGISLLKPIFTQRYIVFTSIAEVLLVAIGLFSIKPNFLKYFASSIAITASIVFLFWYPAKVAKTDFKTPFAEISQQFEVGDIILNESPLTFFNALYYAPDQRSVYLLKEDDSPLPLYVGAILIPRTKWAYEIPNNRRVFLIRMDGSYEIFYPTS